MADLITANERVAAEAIDCIQFDTAGDPGPGQAHPQERAALGL